MFSKFNYNRELLNHSDFSNIFTKMEEILTTNKLAKFYRILHPLKTMKNQSISTFNFWAKIPPTITF